MSDNLLECSFAKLLPLLKCVPKEATSPFHSLNMALELRYKINGHELLKILIFIKICARK